MMLIKKENRSCVKTEQREEEDEDNQNSKRLHKITLKALVEFSNEH